MERLRGVLRGVLGWDSRAYRFGAELLNLVSLIRIEGLATTRTLLHLRSASPGGSARAINFARLAYPFFIRPGTKDVTVAINNFVREEYGAVIHVLQPRLLVDGGAYIGDTSAYFLSRYPSLRSIALEPMEDNLKIARRNLALYGDRVELLSMALTADGARVHMSGVETGARVSDSGCVEVPSTTIAQILSSLPEGRIDILKLDIEGAEGPIFAQQPEAWLPYVDSIIVETHGPAITTTVLDALDRNGWIAERHRHLYFCCPTV